jgi:predicted nucleotidyltransferase
VVASSSTCASPWLYGWTRRAGVGKVTVMTTSRIGNALGLLAVKVQFQVAHASSSGRGACRRTPGSILPVWNLIARLAVYWHDVRMDLTVPLQSLIPSVDSSALTVLAGTEGALGASQIHQLAPRGTRRGLGVVLDRLVEHGLVIAEATNHGYMYRLNRDHVLAPAVLTAAGARQEFLRRLMDGCAQLRPPVVSAALFGSVARRESGPDSDVDLLLVVADDTGTDDTTWSDQVRHLQAQVLAWSGNRLEIVTVTRTHLADLVVGDEPIVGSWRDDAMTLAGSGLPKLLDELSARHRRARTKARGEE